MNSYLKNIGSNLKELRTAVNWTQKDLANKIGISRYTVVNIEKDSTEITKTMALALYCTVRYELNNRRKKIEELDLENIVDKENMEKMKKTLLGIGLSSSVISSHIVMPFLGPLGIIGSAVSNVFKSNKTSLKNFAKDEVIKTIYKSFEQIEKTAANTFELEDINDVDLFMKKIKNIENEKK